MVFNFHRKTIRLVRNGVLFFLFVTSFSLANKMSEVRVSVPIFCTIPCIYFYMLSYTFGMLFINYDLSKNTRVCSQPASIRAGIFLYFAVIVEQSSSESCKQIRTRLFCCYCCFLFSCTHRQYFSIQSFQQQELFHFLLVGKRTVGPAGLP